MDPDCQTITQSTKSNTSNLSLNSIEKTSEKETQNLEISKSYILIDDAYTDSNNRSITQKTFTSPKMKKKRKTHRSEGIQETEIENLKDKILEHSIKYKFDFYDEEFEEDLIQLKKRDSSYNQNYCELVRYYPYDKPIYLSKIQTELYGVFIGLKAYKGNIPAFLDGTKKNVPMKVFKSRILPEIKRCAKLFELVLSWVFKRYQYHGKIFTYTKSKIERSLISRVVSDLLEKERKIAHRVKEEDIFMNENNEFIRKTVTGRTSTYIRVGQL